MANHGNQRRVVLHLECPPEAGLVSTTRQYVATFLGCIGLDEDSVGRLALAVHELMENMVKYSTAPTVELSVEVDPCAGNEFMVRTVNVAADAGVANLKSRIAEIRAAHDPAEFYDAVIRRALVQDDGESGLGLARLRAEAGMEIDCHDDGGRVTVCATGRPIAAEGA